MSCWRGMGRKGCRYGETGEITVEDGYFVNVDAPSEIVLNPFN